jgi:galactokinase
MQAAELKNEFVRLYGREPRIFRAPGRVNIIGEHTDYNDGFVFPAAINLFTWVAIAPRDDRRIVIRTENLHEQVDFSLDSPAPIAPRHWTSYVRGVARALEEGGYPPRGADLLIRGEVPLGAGVSSSASLEVAVGYALVAIAGRTIECRRLAQICQRAENEYVGAHTGIMDQLASSCAVSGRALLLDCRSLEFRALPIPEGLRLVICNSMIRRELSSSAYNTRREECEQGVRILAGLIPGVRALRDVTFAQLEEFRSKLPEIVYKRCRHVVTEDDRVLTAAMAFENNELDRLSRAMAESHRSLRDDFQVSCPELDLLVELADNSAGVHGARMTGAGFGGCTINLVHSDFVNPFRARISAEYERRTKLKPDIYVCDAASGAGPADPDSSGSAT